MELTGGADGRTGGSGRGINIVVEANRITGQGWRLLELQERYDEHFSTVILRWIEEQKTAR